MKRPGRVGRVFTLRLVEAEERALRASMKRADDEPQSLLWAAAQRRPRRGFGPFVVWAALQWAKSQKPP